MSRRTTQRKNRKPGAVERAWRAAEKARREHEIECCGGVEPCDRWKELERAAGEAWVKFWVSTERKYHAAER